MEVVFSFGGGKRPAGQVIWAALEGGILHSLAYRANRDISQLKFPKL
jgi:hypothetical protein